VNFVEDFLANADLSAVPQGLRDFRPAASLLLCSRLETARYATVLLLDERGTPRMVAKIARRPHSPERLHSEWELLRALASRCQGDPPAPLPLALAEHRGQWLLLQTALTGTLLHRHRLSKSPQRVWRRVEEWLFRLPTPTALVDDAWHADQISTPMRLLEEALPATAEERQLFAATETLTRELVELKLPAPIEHGDLYRANMMVSRRGLLSAIDWELGRVAGLPGADAAVFLLDVFRMLERLPADEARARAYDRHFLDAGGTGRHWLTDHLARRGVDPRWVEHILLATWARQALDIWQPAVLETVEAPSRQRARARVLFRDFVTLRLWRMTLEHMTR
jgi:hypothetical protein